MNKPLSNILEPKTINDVIGQEHLIGKDKILTNIIKTKEMFSIILYGRPGIGKTSIAHALINDLNLKYREINAVNSNKKDLDIIIEEAKMYGGIILIIDEIHRLNKDKQDILLPNLENGLIKLIGMTTSNPYYSINPAIRSRCFIFELNDLDKEDIKKALKKALKHYLLKDYKVNNNTISLIANIASGDLRYAYNLLDIARIASKDKIIDEDVIKNINTKAVFAADKNSKEHYDVLSGLQKSIRGSDVNASLHYLARLITIGDLDSIYRRLSVIAYEDIGVANPSIGPKVMSAIQAAELVGLPEARIPLGTIVVEMALSPKSNTAHIALDLALKDIENGTTGNLPKHIKTNSKDYLYPHDYPNAYVKQQYLPDKIKNKKYYKPKELGYEKKLFDTYKKINEINH